MAVSGLQYGPSGYTVHGMYMVDSPGGLPSWVYPHPEALKTLKS